MPKSRLGEFFNTFDAFPEEPKSHGGFGGEGKIGFFKMSRTACLYGMLPDP